MREQRLILQSLFEGSAHMIWTVKHRAFGFSLLGGYLKILILDSVTRLCMDYSDSETLALPLKMKLTASLMPAASIQDSQESFKISSCFKGDSVSAS